MEFLNYGTFLERFIENTPISKKSLYGTFVFDFLPLLIKLEQKVFHLEAFVLTFTSELTKNVSKLDFFTLNLYRKVQTIKNPIWKLYFFMLMQLKRQKSKQKLP